MFPIPRNLVCSSDLTSLRVLFAPLALAALLSAQTVQAPFDQNYTYRTLGSVPGLGRQYGAAIFDRDDPNTLLVTEWNVATSTTPSLFSIGVARDPQGHVTGFVGQAKPIGFVPFIDGGLAYAPNGVLFYSRYWRYGPTGSPINEISQLKPGSTAPDRTDQAMLPVTLGGLAFVPPGVPGAGRLKTSRWPGGQWFDAQVTPDGTGTYNIVGETQTQTLPGQIDGFAYVPLHSPNFTGADVIVAEYGSGVIATYQTDSIGDPVVSSRRSMVTSVRGVFSFAIDPVTLDLLVVNWISAGSNLGLIEGFGGCGPAVHYGTGLAGTGGVPPRITGLACARVGETMGTFVDRGLANAPGTLFLGSAQQSIPVLGGTLLNNLVIGVANRLDPQGQWTLRINLPNTPALANVSIYFQAVYFDPDAVFGVSMTDGLCVTIR